MTLTFNVENEAIRQVYLQEMGIQPWFPRYPLQHAASQRRYPAHATLPDMSEPAVTRPTDAMAGAADPQKQLKDFVQPEPTPRVQQPSAKTTERTQAGTIAPDLEIPHFAFSYLNVSSHLAVICEIPYQSRGRLQAPVRELLARILEALGIAVQPGATPVIHFQWPLQETNELEQGMDRARQTIQGFMARQLRDHPVPLLLVFSERWPDWMFPAAYLAVDGQQPACLLQHPEFAVKIMVTHGLHAMLEKEELKKPAWAQMKTLKAALDTVAKPATGSQQGAEGLHD